MFTMCIGSLLPSMPNSLSINLNCLKPDHVSCMQKLWGGTVVHVLVDKEDEESEWFLNMIVEVEKYDWEEGIHVHAVAAVLQAAGL